MWWALAFQICLGSAVIVTCCILFGWVLVGPVLSLTPGYTSAYLRYLFRSVAAPHSLPCPSRLNSRRFDIGLQILNNNTKLYKIPLYSLIQTHINGMLWDRLYFRLTSLLVDSWCCALCTVQMPCSPPKDSEIYHGIRSALVSCSGFTKPQFLSYRLCVLKEPSTKILDNERTISLQSCFQYSWLKKTLMG